jgi:hypothetical protein
MDMARHPKRTMGDYKAVFPAPEKLPFYPGYDVYIKPLKEEGVVTQVLRATETHQLGYCIITDSNYLVWTVAENLVDSLSYRPLRTRPSGLMVANHPEDFKWALLSTPFTDELYRLLYKGKITRWLYYWGVVERNRLGVKFGIVRVKSISSIRGIGFASDNVITLRSD